MYYNETLIDKIDGEAGLKIINERGLKDNHNIEIAINLKEDIYMTRGSRENPMDRGIWCGTVKEFKEQFCITKECSETKYTHFVCKKCEDRDDFNICEDCVFYNTYRQE